MRPGLAASLIAGVSFFLASEVGAAPFGVQLGPDRLQFDTPSGFSDTAAFGSPRLTEIAENLADPSSRVLVFALSDADVRRFSAGDSLELRRYLLAVTPRGKQNERMATAQFTKLVEETARNLGAPPDPSLNWMQYLQGRTAGQAHLLVELNRDPQALSVLTGTMVPQPPPSMWRADKPPVYKLSTTTVTTIRGRAIYLYAFSAFEGPDDATWIKSITQRWLEELQRINQ
jgi:hypothetical protein